MTEQRKKQIIEWLDRLTNDMEDFWNNGELDKKVSINTVGAMHKEILVSEGMEEIVEATGVTPEMRYVESLDRYEYGIMYNGYWLHIFAGEDFKDAI